MDDHVVLDEGRQVEYAQGLIILYLPQLVHVLVQDEQLEYLLEIIKRYFSDGQLRVLLDQDLFYELVEGSGSEYL